MHPQVVVWDFYHQEYLVRVLLAVVVDIVDVLLYC